MAIQCNNDGMYVSMPTLTLTGAYTLAFRFFGNTLGQGLLGTNATTAKIVTLAGNSIFVRPVSNSFSFGVTLNAGWNLLIIKRNSSNVYSHSLNGADFTLTSFTESGNVIWERMGWASGQLGWVNKPYCEFAFWDGEELNNDEVAALANGIRPLEIRRLGLARYYTLEKTGNPDVATNHIDFAGSGETAIEVGETATRDFINADHPPIDTITKMYRSSLNPIFSPIAATARSSIPAIIG